MLCTVKPKQQTSCWKQYKPEDSKAMSLKSRKKEGKERKK